jgi:hypothetical protein
MIISKHLLSWCKKGNCIIGCAEPTPPAYADEGFVTTDDDWEQAIRTRLREVSMDDLIRDLFEYETSTEVKMLLYNEILNLTRLTA